MPSTVDVDCSTGRATVRDMTAEEITAHQQLKTSAQKAKQAHDDEQAARDATLTQMAQKIGVDVGELKAALRLGPVPGKKP